MIQIPPTLTETEARVHESYVKWYNAYYSSSPFLQDEKQKQLERHLAVAQAFNNELRREIGLEDA